MLSFLNLNTLCVTIYFVTCVLHLCEYCFSVSDECKLNEIDETLCCISEKYVGMRPLYIKGFFVFYEWSMLVVLSLITLCAMQ